MFFLCFHPLTPPHPTTPGEGDVTGLIAGCLYGLLYGRAQVPGGLVQDLDKRQQLEDIGAALYKAASAENCSDK